MADLRIGMIGLDTSHVPAFTKLLNDPANEHHVPGGRVTVAFPGGSQDIDLSRNRVEGFTSELRDKWGVKIVDSPEAVAEACDILFLESIDGRVHRPQFEQTVKYRRPTFIDKPFTINSGDAEAILKLGKEHGVPVMSCSALRYADNFVQAVKEKKGNIFGIDVYGPMAEIPQIPGLFWYGIHAVEMVITAMGTGLKEVHAVRNGDFDLVTGEWADGRIVTVRGTRKGHGTFGALLHDQNRATYIDLQVPQRPYYASMLSAIMSSLPQGRSDIPDAEMIEVIDFIEAANESRKTGHVVRL